MDLQLGLALTLALPPTSITNHDDNNTNSNPHLSTSSSSSRSSFNKKRSFSQLILFLDDHRASSANNNNSREVVTLPPTTLPLLPLTPNHHAAAASNCSTTMITESDDSNDDDAELLGPVGWPPLNSYWRKRLRYAHYNYNSSISEDDHHHEVAARNNTIDHHRRCRRHGSVGSSKGSNTHTTTPYVKVKMEGVAIARKVDLSLHHSFQTLKYTLLDMFGKCNQYSKSYELAYQDEEGDWLLAEDVPWRSFIQCAQRLKLLKIE